MGCGSSKTTVVQPMRSDELERNEEETGGKHGGRGESAVSKGTTDSGVVMESREIPMLPGAVPRKLPPLTVASPGLLQQESLAVERPKSSEILEQLLIQGIIPVGQPRERRPGEAYNIMLDDRDTPRRRPPARLESLEARKEQSPTSREAIDQKMRQAEERRKLREDELKTRLRSKSARVRAPTSSAPEELATPVEQLQNPLIPDLPGSTGSREDPAEPLPHTQVREATRGLAEREREGGGDGREGGGGGGRERWREDGKGSMGGDGGEDGVRGRGDGGGFQEEVTRVEEPKAGELFTASREFESDPTLHHAEDNEEVF